MAKGTRRVTIEILDNHWKDAPIWSFLLLLVALIGVISVTFLGALLILKGNLFLSSVLGIVTGGGIYILVYKLIQFRTSSSRNADSKGVITASLLSLPFLSLAFFGGATLSNEFGLRSAQIAEFDKINSRTRHTLTELDSLFSNSNTYIQTELQSLCTACSAMSSLSERSQFADSLKRCFGIADALQCANSASPDLLERLKGNVNEVFVAKSEAHLRIESFIFKAEQRGLRSRFYQYQVQEEAKILDSLFSVLHEKKSNILAGYYCLSEPPPTLPSLSPIPPSTFDCSAASELFCAGWSWISAGILFALALTCLVPVMLSETFETYKPTNASEDKKDSGLSTRL